MIEIPSEVINYSYPILRAMHDGRCSACNHMNLPAKFIHFSETDENEIAKWVCPKCGFTITREQADKLIQANAPVIQRHHEYFLQLVAQLDSGEAPPTSQKVRRNKKVIKKETDV